MATGKVADTRPRWHSTEEPKKKPRVLLDISKPFDDEFRFVLSDARHVAVGYGLKEGNLGYSTRFSRRRTLREQTSAYKRVMDPALGMEKGAPTSNRICQDIRKCILALTGIRDARGICVQGLRYRAGHRAAASSGS